MGPLMAAMSMVPGVMGKDALIRIRELTYDPSYDLVLPQQSLVALKRYPFSMFCEDFSHTLGIWIGFSYPSSWASASSLHNHDLPFACKTSSNHRMVR